MRARFCGYILFIFILLLSCNGKEEAIPSYLKIDSVSIQVNSGQGNEVQQIKGVYLYSPSQLLGLFELPAVIPIHEQGSIKLSLVAAVYLNGSKNRLIPHTGILPLDTTLNLNRGKISSINNPTFSFRTNSSFIWTEDFEDNSSTLVGINIPKGDTSLITQQPFDLDNRFKGITKVYSVLLKAADTAKYMDIGYFKNFENLPADNRDVFLEFDINTNHPVQLALKRQNSAGQEYVPFLYIFNTNGMWKRFYVNLIDEIAQQPSDTKYQILFSSDVAASSHARYFHFDNIRLSYNN